MKITVNKQFNLVHLSCCDKYHKKLYANIVRHFPYFYDYSPVDLQKKYQ